MDDIQSRQTDPTRIPYGVGAACRVYAIGDIHGCADLLRALLIEIEKDWVRARHDQPDLDGTLLYLGDLVDRGPDSRGVIDTVLNGPPTGLQQVVLKGNHELMMLGFLTGEDVSSSSWLINGGLQTAQSYGVITGSDVFGLQQALSKRMPRTHVALLADSVLCHRIGDVFFAHAGIDPEVPLDQQAEDDLIWIRAPFLSSDKDYGVYVVHGHTPVQASDIQENRANIDTGAVYGGWLTAAVLSGQELHHIQVRDGVSHLQHRRLAAWHR